MAPIFYFAFGPDESFFFHSPTGNIHYRTNWAFTQTVPERLQQAYSIALGPGENEYCAFYLDKTSNLHYSINLNTNKVLQPAANHLVNLFKTSGHSLPQSRFILGPNRTYIVITPDETRYGSDEDSDKLRNAMLAQNMSIYKLTEAALGYNGSWWARDVDENICWDFAGCYSELDVLLKSNEVKPSSIKHLVLSTFSPEHYFIVYDVKKVRYCLPQSFARFIAPTIDKYRESSLVAVGVHDGKICGNIGDVKGGNESDPPPYIQNEVGCEDF